jgi:formylmethanofuran dehydrogenase subunit E
MGNFYSEEKQKSGFEKFQEGLEGCSKDSFQFGCGCTVLMAILAILFFILLG